MTLIDIDSMTIDGKPMRCASVTRIASDGPHTVVSPDMSQAQLEKLFPAPVKVSVCGNFKVGDLVRVTDYYIDNIAGGLSGPQARALVKGVRITDIWPPCVPGSNPCDLEAPFDGLMVDTMWLEKV